MKFPLLRTSWTISAELNLPLPASLLRNAVKCGIHSRLVIGWRYGTWRQEYGEQTFLSGENAYKYFDEDEQRNDRVMREAT
jgi:hypothetical protein